MDHTQFKPLPPIEVISVHGEWGFNPGYYKSGDLHQINEGEVVLHVTEFSYSYYLRMDGFWVYHKEDGPAVAYKAGSSKHYIYGIPSGESP